MLEIIFAQLKISSYLQLEIQEFYSAFISEMVSQQTAPQLTELIMSQLYAFHLLRCFLKCTTI
jgi:hypothetical protein